MKKILLFLFTVCVFSKTNAQFVHKIKADSVLITNDSCSAELNLENSTKHVQGFLYNKGNGRTEFRKITKLNDSTIVLGEDTLVIGGSAGNLTASNGVNRTGNDIRLGQAIGAPGDPAAFTSDREIPLDSNRLHFKGGRMTMKLASSYQPVLHVVDSANNSLFWIKALSQYLNTSRGTSIFIGDSAGYHAFANTGTNGQGILRTALGHKAMFNDVESNFSTAIGAYAMEAAGYKPWCTALGYRALGSATTGSTDNTALGYFSIANLLTGHNTVGIGSHVMQGTLHADSSVALGTFSMHVAGAGGTGSYRREVAIGMGAGRQNSGGFTGSRNVRIGFRAGENIGSTAFANVLIGHDVARNIAVGNNKLYIANSSTTNPLIYGEFDNALLRVGGRLKINTVPDVSTADSVLVWTSADSTVKKIASTALIGPHVSSTTSSATITPNALTDDVYAVTALATNTTIAAPAGTFRDGQMIILRLKDNGTSRTVAWNAIYRHGEDFPLPAATQAGKTMYITYIWNAVDSKLDAVGLSKGY